jgi:uncharacterized iron-regulated membrane protein
MFIPSTHKRPVKAALLQVHSLVGLAVGLVLSLIGLTGAIMSFEDEIGNGLNSGIMQVEPRQAPRLTPEQLVARLQSTPELGKVSGLTMSIDASAATRIRFARDDDGGRPASIYVDPYDGRVLGAPRGEQFFATVRQLHRWLLIPGDGKGYGRQITGTAAIGLAVLLISGLVLRWPRRARSIRTWLKPNLAVQGRSFHWSLHSVVATWLLPIYLVMGLTGLWYSFDWYRDAATWLFARPAVAESRMKPKGALRDRPGDTAPASLDRAWSVFLREQGHRYERAQLQLPNGAGTIVRIRSWVRNAGDEGRDELRIDAASGRLVSAEIYADKTLGERVLARVLDIHRGSILGWPGKLLFMLAAALMPLFMVTGFLLYLSRRKLRALKGPAIGRLVPGE